MLRKFLPIIVALCLSSFLTAQDEQHDDSQNRVPNLLYGTCAPSPTAHNGPNSPQNGNGSLGQIYNFSRCGLNYTQATLRLGKRGPLAGVNQPATYVISGIPVCRTIERAYMWASMSGTGFNFNVTIVNPLAQTFTYPSVVIGTGPDKCWGYGGTTSYRIDVTSCITGNGNYIVSGWPTNPPTAQKDTDGATLFIIFSDPTAAYQGHMVIHDGCVVGIGGNTAQTLTGINACAASTYARAFCMTGDWQLNGITGVWNGSAIAIPWNWWNYNEVATNVAAAQVNAAYSHAGLNDCYNWMVMGLYYRTTTCITCPVVNSLTLTTTTIPATCANCNGSATVTATGGSAPYTYVWSTVPPQTTQTATGLCAGTYTVTVTDATGCLVATATVTIITTGGGLTLTPTIVNATCNGLCNGSVSVAVTGGSAPYTYSWNTVPVQNTQTATGLCAGTYIVTVTDAAGCTSTGSYTVTQPTAITTTQTQVNVLCNGNCTGTATVTPSGGTPGYTYSWNTTPVQNTQTATGLCAGNYTVTVTDANGCTRTATYTITQPTALATTQSQVNVLCNGQCTGTATVTASGGTPAYTYAWSPSGGNAATATGLCAGNYTVTVTDANGCTRTATYTITQPTAITTTQSQVNVLCNGQCTGTATVTASGGTPAYTYAWTPSGGNAATATGLCAGNYTVTVTDANGCSRTATYTITQAPPLATTQSQVNILCNAACTGTATVNASGGTPAYTYLWTPSAQNTATATGLCAGSYTVTVTDANGCTITASYTLTQPTALSATTTATQSTCGQANGTATVTVSGGTPAYTYSWAPSGGNAATATGLLSGTYTVTITDANGCTLTATIFVPSALSPTAAINTSTNVTCFGVCNGSATVTVTGGAPAYTYVWAPSGGNAATATGLCAGTYTVTVTDANLCTTTATITITQPTQVVATATNTGNVLCFGGNTGSASASGSGGTPGYTYSWAPSGGNAANATGLTVGTYTVIITDLNGCSATATVVITQPPLLTVTAAGFSALCFGACNGQAVCIPAGGTQPYLFNWMPSGGPNPSATGLCAGTYTVTITDANGCTITDTAIVSQPAALAATTTFDTSHCNLPDGQVCVNVTGGTTPYQYIWNPSAQTGACATNLTPGQYCVTITDFNGCTLSVCENVPLAPGVVLSLTASTNVTCFGACNGSATVNAVGGIGPYTYAWAPSGGNAPVANNLCAGTYTCTVTDFSGCLDTVMVTITQPAVLTLLAGPPATICIGQCTTLTATASGGTAPYTITWAPAGPNVCPVVTTVYTVSVTDANGCTATPQTVVVTVNPPLNVTATLTPNPICIGSSTTLSALGSGGSGTGYTYTWQPNNLNGNSVTVTPTTTGTTTYTVTITDNCGTPAATATVTVTVNPSPVIVFSSADSSGCVPFCTSFTDATLGGASYAWSFPGGSPANSTTSPSGQICWNTPGSYSVTLTVTDNNGCISTITVPNMITVFANPVAAFTPTPSSTSILNPTICFTDNSVNAATWLWDFGDPLDQFNSSTLQSPCHTYGDTGVYCVKQVVTTTNGCPDSITICIYILPDFTLYVPNAFTPDGDGTNDFFFPKGEGIDEDKFEMWIFDRWGNNIWYTQKWGNKWDGAANGGKKIAQEDVYVWKINVYDFLGKKHSYVGHVSLIK